MGWKPIHLWLGLFAGTLALVLGLTGSLLAIDPVSHALQAPAKNEISVAELVQRVSDHLSGVEQIRRLPSGTIVVYSFDGDQARADRIDPSDGSVLGSYQPSALPRWVKNLHRTLLLGDAGRWGAATIGLAMLFISISGLILLLRRMGGWRRIGGRVRGTLAQRIHVLTGRVLLAVLLVTSVTSLYMSATTLGLIELDSRPDPNVISTVTGGAELPAAQLPALQNQALPDLSKLSFPDPQDPESVWEIATAGGEGWIDRYSGEMLLWRDIGRAQRIYDWALLLHTGEGAWPWALVLGLTGAAILLFWLSGIVIWRQAHQNRPRIAANSPLGEAQTLIFVASESGSTWAFAEALHRALVAGGHRVHSAPLEQFQIGPATRRVFVLAATYGDGQAPAHAGNALSRIAQQQAQDIPVTVLGFGDRQFPAFCAFAEDIDRLLRRQGWPELLPLERIHQQSAQQFALWIEALSTALDEPLTIDYRPRVPRTTALRLVARREYQGRDGQQAAILHFEWPAQSGWQRILGRGLGQFTAGDLIGIVPPGSAVPRYYSLASGSKDGFVEICVRRVPEGLCSNYLLDMQLGGEIPAFIRTNPSFALPRSRRPVLLIGAGTGVAPLAGFIRRNDRHVQMHLWFGTRDPACDYYFGSEIERWRDEGRVTSVQTTFSRVPEGGGYVQDALRRDAGRVRELLAKGALVRVCGSRPMAHSVVQVLDDILGDMGLSVAKLKQRERYAEDLF
ncbi:MAG TPA: PepSY domain-containing protein [Pusillimonas sp.]|uniref:PepSY domain-containing protein n=1 Tax=Pusillimonas sp. TaxID=3040095 RepID=UPI002C85840B|nr:PepSY domain-containing protein [Pusillimonas sp.]HUH86886.1 PepSY domain-containing protein [Pusillimonas sp.]